MQWRGEVLGGDAGAGSWAGHRGVTGVQWRGGGAMAGRASCVEVAERGGVPKRERSGGAEVLRRRGAGQGSQLRPQWRTGVLDGGAVAGEGPCVDLPERGGGPKRDAVAGRESCVESRSAAGVLGKARWRGGGPKLGAGVGRGFQLERGGGAGVPDRSTVAGRRFSVRGGERGGSLSRNAVASRSLRSSVRAGRGFQLGVGVLGRKTVAGRGSAVEALSGAGVPGRGGGVVEG